MRLTDSVSFGSRLQVAVLFSRSACAQLATDPLRQHGACDAGNRLRGSGVGGHGAVRSAAPRLRSKQHLGYAANKHRMQQRLAYEQQRRREHPPWGQPRARCDDLGRVQAGVQRQRGVRGLDVDVRQVLHQVLRGLHDVRRRRHERLLQALGRAAPVRISFTRAAAGHGRLLRPDLDGPSSALPWRARLSGLREQPLRLPDRSESLADTAGAGELPSVRPQEQQVLQISVAGLGHGVVGRVLRAVW